ILSRSSRFARHLGEAVDAYTEGVKRAEPCALTDAATVRTYLRGKAAVLLPEEYERTAPGEVIAVLRDYGKKHTLIPCAYEMDEGSFLFLREKIMRLREKKLK
ncbi:MAG: hypothetical protein IIY16_03230, partial [Oscillospiraceae bacterium]|nr:hypothetical protein [Oscillospiraceae bacterium]